MSNDCGPSSGLTAVLERVERRFGSATKAETEGSRCSLTGTARTYSADCPIESASLTA